MDYLTLENVSKYYGDKVLFDNITLHVNQGDKIALVAKNGSGKTTLLRVVAGIEAPEGENNVIRLHRGVRIGYLEQEPNFNPDHSIEEAVFDSDNKLIKAILRYEKSFNNPNDPDEMQSAMIEMDDLKAWDFEAKIKETLSKLNIDNLNQKIGQLSGGQIKRLALAKLILEEPEFLILDEPTNHLDLNMIEWLEVYLQRSSITLFMVTHDRYFLERVCNSIVELDEGNLFRYKGSYSDFLEKKSARHENESVVLDKTKKLFKKELDWVRRSPKARGTKAKSRVDKFEEIKEKAHQQRSKDLMQIDMKGARLGSKILELDGVSKSYGDLKILENFHYKFRKKERVGIVGPNGVGKTTFLKMLTKEIRPDHGRVVVGDTVVFGYYTQDGLDLKVDRRVIDVVRSIADYIPMEGGYKLTAEQLLERFLFNRKQQDVFVSRLSGGERRRLYLLTVLMKNPNFLILDEPTNDLDILTLNVLEEFLMEFAGCIIIVSHDRYFMDKVVEHLFIFEGDGKIKDYNSNYSDYRKAKKIEINEQKRKERESTPKVTKEKETSSAEPARKLTYMERKEMGRLEKEIAKLEAKKAEIFEKFNDPSLSGDEISKLSIESGKIGEEIEEKEMRWLELSEFA